MDRTIFDIQADFCKAMGNATRLQILHTLRKGAMIVGDIARETGLSQSLVSRQLGVLRNIGVLKCHRRGNEMIYELAHEDIEEVCDLVRKVLVNQIQNQTRIL